MTGARDAWMSAVAEDQALVAAGDADRPFPGGAGEGGRRFSRAEDGAARVVGPGGAVPAQDQRPEAPAVGAGQHRPDDIHVGGGAGRDSGHAEAWVTAE